MVLLTPTTGINGCPCGTRSSCCHPASRCTLRTRACLMATTKKFNLWLGITVALGIIFVGLQAAEYYEAYAHFGLTLNSGIYGSTFFMLTGFHGFPRVHGYDHAG